MPGTRGDEFLQGSKATHDVSIPGKHGSDAEAGVYTLHLPPGNTTGQIVRYNSATDAWEVASEPFVFKGLVLTPALASLVTAEGAIYYDSSLKAIMVCTEEA